MNTLKPLFIVGAMGLASWVVYSAISRGPDSEKAPPHVEGLTGPETGAPLVQMPGSPSSGSPFGAAGPEGSQSPPPWSGATSVPGSSPSGSRFEATPPADSNPRAYPGESIYASAADPPPGTPYPSSPGREMDSGRSHSGPPPSSEAPAFSAESPRNAPPAGGPACENGCPIDPPPGRGSEPADADAPAWPSSRSAAELAPPDPTQASRHVEEAPGYAGPSAVGPPEPDNDRGGPRDEADQAFERLMDQVSRELDAGRLAEAHEVLSRFYFQPGLTPQQSRQVAELLDQLAGTVIYSRQSLLEPLYVVRPGDTLQSIAERYDVPPALLANINGIRDPRGPQPGQELKVVRGPFHAVVHLADHELILMLGKLYAGRFRIAVGRDQPNLEGAYVVADKGVGPTYYGPDGATFDEHDPRNPLGNLWLGLGQRVGQATRIGIHGTNDPQNIGRDAPRGNIGLDQRDVEDVYGILSVGSRVIIQR